MGQYYMIVNLDRKEFIHPHQVGSGLKMWEVCANNVARVLPYLMAQTNGRGGGDPRDDPPNFGRWAGDRIIVIGDYNKEDLYGDLYHRVTDEDSEFDEISDEIRDEFNRFIDTEDMELGEGL